MLEIGYEMNISKPDLVRDLLARKPTFTAHWVLATGEGNSKEFYLLPHKKLPIQDEFLRLVSTILAH